MGRGQGSRDAEGARAVRGVGGRQPQMTIGVETRQTLENVKGILGAAFTRRKSTLRTRRMLSLSRF